MSLSARIAVGSSRRIAVLATVASIGGIVVAAVTAATRWPAAASLVVAAAIAAIGLLLFEDARLRRDAVRYAVTVSDRAEIDVFPDPESDDERSWRLTDSTMIWPGFSVMALQKGDGASHRGRTLWLPILDVDLGAIDRRSSNRFLLWSLRGGNRTGRAPVRGNRPS